MNAAINRCRSGPSRPDVANVMNEGERAIAIAARITPHSLAGGREDERCREQTADDRERKRTAVRLAGDEVSGSQRQHPQRMVEDLHALHGIPRESQSAARVLCGAERVVGGIAQPGGSEEQDEEKRERERGHEPPVHTGGEYTGIRSAELEVRNEVRSAIVDVPNKQKGRSRLHRSGLECQPVSPAP